MTAVASSGSAKVTFRRTSRSSSRASSTRRGSRLQGVDDARARPALVERTRGEMTVAEIDLRVGGAWRYVMVAHGGFEVGFHGEYREIVENERLVYTEVYEGPWPDGEPAVNTATFTGDRRAHDAVWLLTVSIRCRTRDAIIATGMEGGMQEGMDLLEQVAISLR